MRKNFHLPAAPFRAILMQHMEQNGVELLAVADRLGITSRSLYRITSHEQDFISFDLADLIVTTLLGPFSWHEDDELRALYMAADLRVIDWAHPVSETVRTRLGEAARMFVKRHGTISAASAALGLSQGSFSRYLT